MTLRVLKVTLGGASGNLVVRAALTVPHPSRNTPNKQIHCKTNGFFDDFAVVAGVTWGRLRGTWGTSGATRGCVKGSGRAMCSKCCFFVSFISIFKTDTCGCIAKEIVSVSQECRNEVPG